MWQTFCAGPFPERQRMGMTVGVLSGSSWPGHTRAVPLIGAAGWTLALLPLALSVYFASSLGAVASGETFHVRQDSVPALGVNLSFTLDGLSLLFALLISGVGALILVYAGGYMAGHHGLGRLYAYLLMFMAAMLGLVLVTTSSSCSSSGS